MFFPATVTGHAMTVKQMFPQPSNPARGLCRKRSTVLESLFFPGWCLESPRCLDRVLCVCALAAQHSLLRVRPGVFKLHCRSSWSSGVLVCVCERTAQHILWLCCLSLINVPSYGGRDGSFLCVSEGFVVIIPISVTCLLVSRPGCVLRVGAGGMHDGQNRVE